MSFGGFGGFGQQNNAQQQQQQPAFGGFGAQSTAPATGFGAPAATNAFGSSTNTGGGLFGGTSSGFGSSGGFGATQNTGFGAAKPAFGAAAPATGGGLFGSTGTSNTTSGFGGFGSTNTAASTGFGASTNTGGGLFGAAKPAFGASATTSSPFGGGTSTGFGGASTSAFGGSGTALGANVGECQGTQNPPFQPFVEKEPQSTTNQQNSFQHISFLPAYQKFSPEELRVADYVKGQRFGNANGQAGAFGASSGFGGFGASNTSTGFGATNNTGGGLFGSTNTSTPFGQSQPASTGFGASNTNTGGLFGAKPAATTGGLFGSAAPAATGTGLFGNSTGSTGGFGSTPATSTGFGATNTGSSLFGATQNKSPFSFGNAQPATATTGFGATNTTGGFGSTNNGGGLFGNNNAQQTTTPAFGAANTTTNANPFGGFGANNAQQQNNTNSLFGNKPATTGLFGGATNNNAPAATGTGLFGNAQANTGGGLFGNTQANTGNSLFGAKPATTGGLFGNTQANQPQQGTGLFGGFGQNQNANQQQQQQNTGTGLFGNSATQNRPSLFGAQPAAGGLFGSTNNNAGSGGLFGGLNNSTQQQPQNSLFGGSLGNLQQSTSSQPQSLTASINDPTAFGTSMFANLATPQIHNPGPLATPLKSLSTQRKPGVLPMHRMNPASSSRYSTPQRRGYGFSYSTYGTPGSASSTTSTPGITFNNSLLGQGLNRGLSKSVSASSLRSSYASPFNREESILAPGAFSASPSSRFNSTGSMKKLVINRSLRTDLFSPPQKDAASSPSQGGILKKRVSFDASTVGGSNTSTNGSNDSDKWSNASNAGSDLSDRSSNSSSNGLSQNGNIFSSPLKQVTSSSSLSAPDQNGSARPGSRSGNGNSSKLRDSAPEMEQVKGNELAIVPEEEASAATSNQSQALIVSQEDQEPGQYWMKPTKGEIMKMNRQQRQQVEHFAVGRDGVGSVHFDIPVDLSNIDLDSIPDGLVKLEIRQATVYPDASKKPPMGKGLNVPSTIRLMNSWPRGRDKKQPTHEKTGHRFQKHIERLRKVPNTKFLDYNSETGMWIFQVEHFTTYGLDYDDEDETEVDATSQFESPLSELPATPTPPSRSSSKDASFRSSDNSRVSEESDPEDTFDFKKRGAKVLPGAFGNQPVYEEDADAEMQDNEEVSFLDKRSVGSQPEDRDHNDVGMDESHVREDDRADVSQGRELVETEDQEMAGAYPGLDATAELIDHLHGGAAEGADEGVPQTPGAIVRARLRAQSQMKNSPLKRKFDFGGEGDGWADMLKSTVSPMKQNREELKKKWDDVLDGKIAPEEARKSVAAPPPRSRVVSDGRGFATSIDLMHSLFGEARSPAKKPAPPPKSMAFEWPYAKQQKTNDENMNEKEVEFHDSFKPGWDACGTLVYASNAEGTSRPASRKGDRDGLLVTQKNGVVSEQREVKFAKLSSETHPNALKRQKALTTITTREGIPEAHLSTTFKFDDFFDDGNAHDQATAHEKLVWELAGVLFDDIEVPDDMKDVDGALTLLRKEKLSAFWEKLVSQATAEHVAMTKSSEEKAIASLSGHRIADACGHLLHGKDYHQATLVALIGGDETMKKDMKEQLSNWKKSSVLSEFNQPIRAIYELLAGNVCVCDGSKTGPLEDRIESFILSKRFGLDWRQAFGLRLWYATQFSDDIAEAINLFAEDLEQDKETTRPLAWYVEQGIPPLWDDPSRSEREDLLWGLLKLYANPKADLESILRPENAQLSPLDVRLSWQLSNALIAHDKASYGPNTKEADDKADALTFAFAAQLTTSGRWLDALFVLLHLSSDSARAKSAREHIARHAHLIGTPDSTAFNTLKEELKIPEQWIWECKALHQRACAVGAGAVGGDSGDSRVEVMCLLKAELYAEAHRVLAANVAPTCVIERDYDSLRTLLAGFRGKEGGIGEWTLGGEVYSDFLLLQEAMRKVGTSAGSSGGSRGSSSRGGWGEKVDDKVVAVVERLAAALPAMVDEGRRPEPGFLEEVAAQEMAKGVARVLVVMGERSQNKDMARVLRLPLTVDTRLRYTVELGLGYYKAVMAGGR